MRLANRDRPLARLRALLRAELAQRLLAQPVAERRLDEPGRVDHDHVRAVAVLDADADVVALDAARPDHGMLRYETADEAGANAAVMARAEADHSDRLRAAGVVRSAVEGLPVSVKDLFDVAGDVTLAGSKALEGAPPAAADALSALGLVDDPRLET